MRYIEFGQDKTRVSQLVLGCMRIPQLQEPQLVKELLDFALSNGINMLDTADVYSLGRSEELLGEAFSLESGLRDKFFVQTKCGIRKDPHLYDFSKKHILESVEGSLKRLKTDHIDCLILHRPDPLMDPCEIGEAFNILKASGKVLNFGVSNMNPMQMQLLQSGLDCNLVANQVQFSVCHTPMINHGINVNMYNNPAINRDGGILEYCRLKKMVVQAWSVLQHGFFEGMFVGSPKYLRLNSVLDRIAEENNCKSTAVAIAWVLKYPGLMQAIIGTTKISRVKTAAAACEIELSREQWYEIYQAAGNELP